MDRDQEDGSDEGFGALLKFTVAGYVGGLLLGAALDGRGLQKSGIGQGLVRTLSGEGESILEGIYALRSRLRSGPGGMAEAYGWGKLLGVGFPWLIDATSRGAGVDVYGVESFYIPFFYAMSDQVGANISGLLFIRRRHEGRLADTFLAYLDHPVMLAGLAVILVVPVGLAIARTLGFNPDTQVLTAVETIAANLCWIPPLVGWLSERRIRRPNTRIK